MKKDENPTKTEFYQIIYKRRKVKKKTKFRGWSYFTRPKLKLGITLYRCCS